MTSEATGNADEHGEDRKPRWGAEPDWSKLANLPRKNRPVDVPQWGVSKFDARDLLSSTDPAEPVPAWQTPGFTQSGEPDVPREPQPMTPAEDVQGEAHAQPQPQPHDAQPQAPTLRAEAEQVLQRLVASDTAHLREDQWTAIQELVEQARRVLVVQRTGWGKSAVYFVATSLLRATGAGPTIIISPLLALMRDQVGAAERAGIRAVTINSSNVTEWEQIHEQIALGTIDVLLCSPERLNNPAFRDEVLPQLAHTAGLVVIDEAHCISDWGHDFRPDYRRIRTLIEQLPPAIPVLATTATANDRVTTDVAEQLATGNTDGNQTLVLRGSLDRESLHLAVLPRTDQPTRIAWLIQALENFDGSGIVYCLTVSAAQQVTEQLRARGLNVHAYTGRTETAERETLEDDLKHNRLKALIATSALGMGFDKPDLTFVIHLGAPSSPIAYYQQVGRAGRGVKQARVILAPGVEDQQIWDYFGSLAFPDEPRVRAVLQALTDNAPQSLAQLETCVDLKRNRLEMMLKVLDVDGAVRRVKGGWEATGQPWAYDLDRYERVENARRAEQQLMLDYERTTSCRMFFLRRTLNDPDLPPQWQCGRCDRCSTVPIPAAPDPESVARARTEMDRPGSEVPPRKQWPTAMAALGFELTGRIPASEQPAVGRAVGRLDGLGWSAPLRDLIAPANPDGEVPVALRRAAARTLDDWDQTPTIDGVIQIRSQTRPTLVEHLATGLARYLGKPFVGSIGPAPGHNPGGHDVNSAIRAAGILNRLQPELSEAALNGLPGRTILLVDDYTDSGWTLAVASRILLRAGAGRVVPFVLAIK